MSTKNKCRTNAFQLSTGDVRKCLNQIYRASASSEDGSVDANWLLYNGMTAGHFCTMYVIDNHQKRKQRYKGGQTQQTPLAAPEADDDDSAQKKWNFFVGGGLAQQANMAKTDEGSKFDHYVDQSTVENVADSKEIQVEGQNYMVFSYASPQSSQKCNISAIKIRGVFDSQEEAFAQAKKIQRIDKNFDVWVMDMWKWCPFPPDSTCGDTNSEMHYEQQSQQLADLMSHINDEKMARNKEFIERLEQNIE